MTKEMVNNAIRLEAEAKGFKVTEQEGFQGLVEIISEELNFTYTVKHTENTDWQARKIEQSVTVQASVRKMGGNPTVEELVKTADEIKNGARLMEILNGLNLIWTETF